VLLWPGGGRAQPALPPAIGFELFGSIAGGTLFRVEDQRLGDGLNLGAGIAAVHRSGLGVELEWNRTLGLTANPAPCGLVGISCEGAAREGVTSATIVSVNALYHFGRSRFRPYVTGGAGVLRSAGFSSILHVREDRAVFQEERWTDTGLALNAGFGVKIRLGRSLWLRPELRVYDASLRSRANLSLLRISAGIGYHW
jgi:opacity protein-like surface antigen